MPKTRRLGRFLGHLHSRDHPLHDLGQILTRIFQGTMMRLDLASGHAAKADKRKHLGLASLMPPAIFCKDSDVRVSCSSKLGRPAAQTQRIAPHYTALHRLLLQLCREELHLRMELLAFSLQVRKAIDSRRRPPDAVAQDLAGRCAASPPSPGHRHASSSHSCAAQPNFLLHDEVEAQRLQAASASANCHRLP